MLFAPAIWAILLDNRKLMQKPCLSGLQFASTKERSWFFCIAAIPLDCSLGWADCHASVQWMFPYGNNSLRLLWKKLPRNICEQVHPGTSGVRFKSHTGNVYGTIHSDVSVQLLTQSPCISVQIPESEGTGLVAYSSPAQVLGHTSHPLL
jgi:hypothetical protein